MILQSMSRTTYSLPAIDSDWSNTTIYLMGVSKLLLFVFLLHVLPFCSIPAISKCPPVNFLHSTKNLTKLLLQQLLWCSLPCTDLLFLTIIEATTAKTTIIEAVTVLPRQLF